MAHGHGACPGITAEQRRALKARRAGITAEERRAEPELPRRGEERGEREEEDRRSAPARASARLLRNRTSATGLDKTPRRQARAQLSSSRHDDRRTHDHRDLTLRELEPRGRGPVALRQRA